MPIPRRISGDEGVFIMDGFYAVDYYIEDLTTGETCDSSRVCQMTNPNDQETSDTGTRIGGLVGSSLEGASIELKSETSPRKPDLKQRLRNLENRIIEWLGQYVDSKYEKIVCAGVSIFSGKAVSARSSLHMRNVSVDAFNPRREDLRDCLTVNGNRVHLPSLLWSKLDILPVLVKGRGASIEERACSAVRKAMGLAGITQIQNVSVGFRHQVEVDMNGYIRICELEDYIKTCSADTWNVLSQLVSRTKQRGLRIAFFNSTPQGGGVALMRHALIRFLRLWDVDAEWYVTKPRPDVFEITKLKFHNVLQGISKDVWLTDEDKALFEEWSRDNAERYWMEGPFKTSDVIILDDPQVCGLLPYIRKVNPRCRVIFRCHIEVRGDLILDPNTNTHKTWNYLWQFIKQADLFVFHPVKHFVPKDVPKDKLVLIPATTDKLDGLGKDMLESDLDHYMRMFNRLAHDQIDQRVNIWERPYICQIARFDPSKGYPDVLEAYKLLRERMEAEGKPLEEIPQLVLTGHGSIDDPEGAVVYEQILRLIESPDYERFKSDIFAVRLPPEDRLLDAVLSKAKIALQLSHREGFEVKVTEAIAKGVPVIAYSAGGIPLQIQHGRTGFLVPVGDTQGVADYIYHLMANEEQYNRMSHVSERCVTEEYFTAFQAANWLYLANTLFEQHDFCVPVDGVRVGPSEADSESEDTSDHERYLSADGFAKLVEANVKCARSESATEAKRDEEIVAQWEENRIKLSGRGIWCKELWWNEFLGKGWRKKNMFVTKSGEPVDNDDGFNADVGAEGENFLQKDLVEVQ